MSGYNSSMLSVKQIEMLTNFAIGFLLIQQNKYVKNCWNNKSILGILLSTHIIKKNENRFGFI